MRQLVFAVRQFRIDYGRLPTAQEGLDVLVHKPTDWPSTIPWMPYLETPEIPRDGWGNRFIYVLDPGLAEGFGICSCGQDGVSSSGGNDQDDLNTWNRGKPWLAYYKNQRERENRRRGSIALAITLPVVTTASILLWRAVRTETRSRV